MAEARETSDRREAILAAAERAFNQQGYARTTVEQVATEAGVAKGSIYNYFHSKEELFQQVFANVMSGAEADLARIAPGAEDCHRIEAGQVPVQAPRQGQG